MSGKADTSRESEKSETKSRWVWPKRSTEELLSFKRQHVSRHSELGGWSTNQDKVYIEATVLARTDRSVWKQVSAASDELNFPGRRALPGNYPPNTLAGTLTK